MRILLLAFSCLVLLVACKESSALPFSIGLTPQTVTREPGEMLEATLTLSSRSGAYSNERVQVDVVQLGGSVIDELTEGDVRGMVEGFAAIDPEMSGLGVRWKRMSWTLASDAPSRQRDFSWVCGEGTTAAFFFVTVNGEPVNAPTGLTWQAVRSDSSLEPPVADVIERELGLTPERELELLPIGCGEDPDAGPRDDGGVPDGADAGDGGDGGDGSDGGGVDGGPGGPTRRISGFFTNFYGMAPDGTIWFLAGNPSNELYRVGPSEETPTQRSNAAEIGAALGTTITSYGISALSVTADGAAVVRVQSGATNCLMIARSDSWTPVLCEGDELTDGPIESFNQWAVVADDTIGHLALMVVNVGDVNRLIWVVDTGSDAVLSEVARTMGAMPGLDTTSGIEVIDSLVLSTAGVGGYRMKAFDGTIAVYSDDSTGPSVLAWMNVRADPPVGDPVRPPEEVNISAYSFGNRPIDGLTVNSAGTFAWVVKVIGVDGLLAESGIYSTASDVPVAFSLPGPHLVRDNSVDIVSGFSALPAVQYALLDDDSIVVNGRWRSSLGEVRGQAIWRIDPDLLVADEDIIATGDAAPGRDIGSTLGADIAIGSMGPMVASADGAIAFTARLAGTGIDDTNHAAIFAVTPDGVVLVEQFGEDVELGGTPFAIDLLDMASAAVRAPPLPMEDEPLVGDFLTIDVRDIHVVYGPGTAGRGASFGTAGCGISLYRAGSFIMSSVNVLYADPLPGTCP